MANEQDGQRDDREHDHGIEHVDLGARRVRTMRRIDVIEGQDKFGADDKQAYDATRHDQNALADASRPFDEHEEVHEQKAAPRHERDEKDEMAYQVEPLGNERAVIDRIFHGRRGTQVQDGDEAHP